MTAKVDDLWLVAEEQILQLTGGNGKLLDQREALPLFGPIKRPAQFIELLAHAQVALVGWVGGKKEDADQG